ncbi:hypothetical protein OU426_16950 [Frigidibacter sp. RF13]|uniref:hypothetical protein n=1 Tax=Frigidibacter sp. RF13 TaxID=2997340 RepID=UPI0022721553|nr:hypothetical protein [Frigidibacter sp. RF13]MCY1128552.1 hypothetical protein [Frigidibacter sp. RF13]
MTTFEYKLIPTPRQLAGEGLLADDGASFAPTVQRQINLVTSAGWEFVGREAMPVEKRAWLILRRKVEEDFLVFRRPVTGLDAKPAAPPKVRPRRISRAAALPANVTPFIRSAEPPSAH